MSQKIIHKCDGAGCTRTTTNRETEKGWIYFEAPARDGIYASRSDGVRTDRTAVVSDFCSIGCFDGLLTRLQTLRQPKQGPRKK